MALVFDLNGQLSGTFSNQNGLQLLAGKSCPGPITSKNTMYSDTRDISYSMGPDDFNGDGTLYYCNGDFRYYSSNLSSPRFTDDIGVA